MTRSITTGLVTVMALTIALLVSTTASADLLAHYNFEEGSGDALDQSGNSRNGSLLNGATRVSGGSPFNGGLQALDITAGANSAVNLGAGGLLEDVGGSTFAAWVNPDEFPSGELWLYQTAFSSGRSPLMVAIDGSNNPNSGDGALVGGGVGFQRREYSESGGKLTVATSALTLNTWQHLALSLNYQTGDWAYYIDGNDAGSGTISFWQSNPANTDTDNGGNMLGASTDPSGGFSGLIDDFRLYSHALTQSEVQALVPEPSSVTLLALGLTALAACARRRRRS